jgi:hypothetical protein
MVKRQLLSISAINALKPIALIHLEAERSFDLSLCWLACARLVWPSQPVPRVLMPEVIGDCFRALEAKPSPFVLSFSTRHVLAAQLAIGWWISL